MRFLRACWTLWVPLVVIVIAALCLTFVGYHNAAFLVSYGGTIGVLFANLLYIVIWDSRKRWPSVPWQDRMARVLTFYRDPPRT